MSDNIKVVVKVRPLISREIEEKQQHQWRVHNNTLFQLDSNGRDFGTTFTFDKVYSENTKTSDVYNDVAKPIVQAAVAGFNGTIFAYGQTSSGKTYTMTGTNESPGIIPLAVLNLFEIIKNVPGRDFVVSVSYIEIYNETLKDLLDPKKTVSIKQTLQANVHKVDATDKVTASPEEVLEAMKEGNANRQTAHTNMNENSSRSHSIFQINIESREHIEEGEQVGCVNVSQLNLVDLAGSERAGQTGSTGLRFKEGTAINKSLTSLALVIKHLSEDPTKYINYRDSKLTRILQNSLGGNAKTSIICAITPAALEETNSTLQFATRAKIIKNKPEVNAVATDATMIQKLTKELSSLQSQLETKKNLEVMLETKKNVEQDLQKQIANLQRFILNFGQRPNVELMSGARRKLPPRRITISTLHPTDADVPKVMKFNTPCLKYNPAMLQNAGDFFPTQNPRKSLLSTLPEEPPRLITPPPNERTVNFNDEVIELDSDDDDNIDAPCSPYHKCHGTSKTPPCILRKNAEQAEKSLKDLVELTEREKMYSPSVIELIEKIEQSSAKTTKLQDEIEVLKTMSKEKDLEIETLKSKICSTEGDMKSISSATQVELEVQRKEFNTKLTDWEVSYETLKNKSKLREQELLSLLQEQRTKQADVDKKLQDPEDNEIVHFISSRDISLVNSDNENSIISPDDDILLERTNIIVKDMQAQLHAKNQMVSQLETDINAQKLQIQRLEKSSCDLLSQVDSFKEEVRYLSNENRLLKSTVNELNCTIKSQKENLELAQNDMSSYTSLIQELQIKLTKKESLIYNDNTVLESMLKNEDKTIANNENIKNIINSLKHDLENIKKENDLLKTKMQNNNESEDKNAIHLKTLNEELSKLTKQANENMVTINTLLREKRDLADIEQELVKKICEVEQKNKEHEVICKDQSLLIENLKNENVRLCSNDKVNYLNVNNNDLDKQIHEDKIVMLEEDIKTKKTQIDHLNTENNEVQNCLKLAMHKLQNVLTILTGSVREIPDISDSFVVVYNSVNDNLDKLENIAVETVAQKDLIQNLNLELSNEISALELKHKSKISEVTKEIQNLNECIEKLTNEIKILNDNNNEQNNEIEKLKQALNYKNADLKNFEIQIRDMHAEYLKKDSDLCSLKENEVVLLDQIGTLETEVNKLNCLFKSKENSDEIGKHRIIELEDTLEKKCIKLTETEQTLQEFQKANDQLVESIVRKITDMIEIIKENNSSAKNILMFEYSNIQDHNNILLVLDAVVNHIVLQKPIENDNKELKSKLEEISSYNKILKCDMKQSSKLLQQLKEELQIKSSEIGSMQYKAKEWKQQFMDLDVSMKKQMQFLQTENEKLKNRSLEQNKQFDLLTAEKSIEAASKKSFITPSGNNVENSLPSLVSICLKRTLDILDQRQNDNVVSTTTPSSNTVSSASACRECEQLVLELHSSQQENIRLMHILEQLQTVNKELSKEHSEMNEEVHLLLELTEELQKKIVNHRTNLSILTATTYTENKSLKSQVKGLQHHHTRFHNVCQRDIPELKKQLSNLMGILNDNSSFGDRVGGQVKRFSMPNLLEHTSTSCQIRNGSTFDGDLLMLDTTNANSTIADNTLVGYNQTCLDLTQTVFNETDCQTVDDIAERNIMLRNQIDIFKNDNDMLSMRLEILNKENIDLKEQLTKCFTDKEPNVKDAQSSPMKVSVSIDDLKDLELLTQQLSNTTKQKEDLEVKYNDLILEMPSMDALIYKMKAIEEDSKNKVSELSKMFDVMNSKSKEAKVLQEENDSLSTQVMEHISEVDELSKEVKQLKQENLNLIAQCHALELENKSKAQQCGETDKVLILEQNSNENHAMLNRSVCDMMSDINSRHNKICTLQSEIHAGREDCKVLTEDVVTIKHHLDHSNMSMDLDESMHFELASSSLPGSPQSKKCNMPDIQEERSFDMYTVDKNDCYHYYLDKTGMEKHDLSCNLRIIEVMKLLHENLVTKHGNEVENMANKLKDYQELHANLQTQISSMKAHHAKMTKDLEIKDKNINFISSVVTQLRDNLALIKPIKALDLDAYAKLVDELKDKFLTILDENFNLSSVHIFEQIADHTNKLIEEYSSVCNTLSQNKYHLSEKEKECNFLKAENDKIREVNNVVTLDIIKTEEKNKSIIKQTYQKLVELNMICPDEVTLTEPVNVHVLIRLLEHFINEYQKQKAKAENSLEINEYKASLAEKETQLNELQVQNERLQSIYSKNAGELCKKDDEIKTLETSLNELNSSLSSKQKENDRNLHLIRNMSEEIRNLKESISIKEKNIVSLHNNATKVNELLSTVKNLEDDNIKLRSVNKMITTETESYASELQKSCAIIKQNNIDIDKMTTDILVLRESLNEATTHMEKLKQQILVLSKENIDVRQELEVKSRDCSRLEINIKTHEKTAEVQNRIIMRLQKQKEEEDGSKNTVAEKYATLQAEYEASRNTLKSLNEELHHLKITKQSLENRLSEAEETGRRSRLSIDAITDSSKRRRQSLHDSKRLFEEFEEHKDLSIAFDDDNSGRSTPFGPGLGRDSLPSRADHSDKDDEHQSRPSSALARAARRRRQSSHDLHRSVTPNAPSPTDLSKYVIDELQQLKTDTSKTLQSDTEMTRLRSQLAACEQELEDLKERYREVDEECETCAEYLRERDEQCIRLKKDKAALETQVMELKSKADNPRNSTTFNYKASVAHVSVNTDEDWTNLHAVVVDRMSYDAEVEKNKKLAKTIDELRFSKLELKNTLAKMQKALEKNSGKESSRELEQTKLQLKASNEELRELRARYKELDEECETCAEYLKEREEQCCKLKEAKVALEAKLEELQETSHAMEHTKTVRKKRQTIHDMNRPETSAAEQMDASTETMDDLLSSQDRGDSTQRVDESSRDLVDLKKMVGRLTQQKMHLEMQLKAAQIKNPMFVATGSAIVQNQQITDVMKENQKLKKINAKLVTLCKKRSKSANRENEDPCQ